MPTKASRVIKLKPFTIEAKYGRLYVQGPAARVCRTIPGAAVRKKKRPTDPDIYELSLTLETLARIKQKSGLSSRELAACCSGEVMAWARAAHAAQSRVKDVHRRIADGHRARLPWVDNAGDPVTGEYRPPFDHQKIMATAAVEVDGLAFLCEVGTGKTRAATEAASALVRAGDLDAVIVICLAAGIGEWVDEVPMWSNDLHPVPLRGSMEERREILRRALAGELPVPDGKRPALITNFEALLRITTTIEEGAKAGARVGLIVDEMHKLRNPTAKRTKFAMRLARACRWRLGMTGSPIVNGIQNIWSQWYLVDLGITFGANFVQFRREFFEEDEYTRTINPLDDTASEVGTRIRVRGIRYRKDDCLDLPPRLWQTKYIDMTPAQERAYEAMAEEMVVEMQDLDERAARGEVVATAPIQLTAMMRLSQITSGFLPSEDGGIIRFDPSPKLDELEEQVRDIVSQRESVIIWAWWIPDHEALRDRLADLRPVGIGGIWPRKGVEEAKRLFRSGERPVFIGQQSAAGASLNLQRAPVALYYSQNFDYEHRAQTEGRNHRSGSEIHEKVTYIDYICRGTIDEIIRESLRSKRDTAEIVVDLRDHIGL